MSTQDSAANPSDRKRSSGEKAAGGEAQRGRVGNGKQNSDSEINSGREDGVSSAFQEILENKDLQINICEMNVGFFEDLFKEVFQRKREYLVHQFAQRLRYLGAGVVVEDEEAAEQEWVGIESLSRLRSVVGGRFQNLKKRWVNAGLPLKEHRGDQNLDYTLDEDGWVELTNWVLKQGYEARLRNDKTGYLFELKSLGS